MAWSLGTLVAIRDMETVRATVILTVLVFISLVLFWLVSRADPEGRLLYALLFGSFALKLCALFFRVYTGLLADAFAYNNAGRGIAQLLSVGQWPDLPRLWGTSFLRLLTGLTYFVVGPTFTGISILWAWFGLIGMLLYYKAFTTVFPQGHRRLYLLLMFFYPSLLLWTSSLGKDAVMMMVAGMAVYGLARLRRGLDIVGLVCLALGFAGMFAIRPHIAAIFAAAAGISVVTQPIGGRLGPVVRIAVLVLALGAAVGVAITASRLVGIESLESEEVGEFIGRRQTGTGDARTAGSSFTPIDTGTPVGMALLVPTVLFRPFPFEANNLSALVASMEGLGLLALILYRFRSVRAAIGAAVRNNFLLFSVIFALMFIYLFSAIANFGIIARQRVQVFPFVFMWIAYLGPHRPTRQ